MATRKTFSQMAEVEREKAAKALGMMILMLEERYSIHQIGEKIKLEPWQVDFNIREILYYVRRHLGKWQCIKEILFVK